MTSPFLAQISMMSSNFAPRGWALCNGALLPINQNQALFSLMGTTYGGNGQTNFALPNLQSRLPMHLGQGHVLGETAGATSDTINQSTMPAHNHLFNVTTASASAAAVGPTLLPAVPTVANSAFYADNKASPALELQTLAAGSCGNAGGSQSHNNLMPTLCITFIVALQGIFPSQN